MRTLLVILLMFFIVGCGVVTETTEYKDTYSEIVRREPYPILREYNKKDGWIEFVSTTGTIEVARIYHSHSTEDSISVKCPVGHDGDIITIQVRGKTCTMTMYDNDYHNIVFWTGYGVNYPDQKYMSVDGDVLDVNNQYDFVRLFINNVLTECYYLSDF